MAAPYEFNISTRIVYGRNAAAQMGEIAGGFNLKKIQLITDKGVANSGTLDYLLRPLKDAGIAAIIYDDVEYNPTVQTVDKAAKQFRDEDCDGVISVGGGSPIDAGKCIGVLATNPGSASDYLGVDKVKNPSVLQTPYFSPKIGYGFQIPIPGRVLYYYLTSSPDLPLSWPHGKPISSNVPNINIFYFYRKLGKMQAKIPISGQTANWNLVLRCCSAEVLRSKGSRDKWRG